jgi:hypothetical protein
MSQFLAAGCTSTSCKIPSLNLLPFDKFLLSSGRVFPVEQEKKERMGDVRWIGGFINLPWASLQGVRLRGENVIRRDFTAQSFP